MKRMTWWVTKKIQMKKTSITSRHNHPVLTNNQSHPNQKITMNQMKKTLKFTCTVSNNVNKTQISHWMLVTDPCKTSIHYFKISKQWWAPIIWTCRITWDKTRLISRWILLIKHWIQHKAWLFLIMVSNLARDNLSFINNRIRFNNSSNFPRPKNSMKMMMSWMKMATHSLHLNKFAT